MRRRTTAFALSTFIISAACSGSSEDTSLTASPGASGASGSTAAGAAGKAAGGNSAGSAGSPAGSGGTSAGGAGGSAGGSAGSPAGSGGTSAGSAGTSAGSGGSPAGSGGSTAGKAGASASAGASGKAGAGGAAPSNKGKVDLLFLVDNSASMADKQKLLSLAATELVQRLVSPPCLDASGEPSATQPAGPSEACAVGTSRQFLPVTDLHVGIVTSSLGSHGADVCPTNGASPAANPTKDDGGRLITRDTTGATVPTYQSKGFFSWDPLAKKSPPGESDPVAFATGVAKVIEGAGQIGCGFEATLEGFYRFLIDPRPPTSVVAPTNGGGFDLTKPAVVTGLDNTLLAQRKAFLRDDSSLVVVVLTDENDCSLVDGRLPAKICENPKLDAQGVPTGCNGAPVDAPAAYLAGSLHGSDTYPAMFTPAVLQSGQFRMRGGTTACATDPYSAACASCLYGDVNQDPACVGGGVLTQQKDNVGLRCFDQKRRFGVDFAYPIARYVDGLTKPTVIDRDGYVLPNPIFAGGRAVSDVTLVSIVGVPWQDLAKNPANLAEGYADTVDWSLVLGAPYASPPVAAGDPLMRESDKPRTTGVAHPVTGDLISPTKWNAIAGYEWQTQGTDLEYACLFDLPTPLNCATANCECTGSVTSPVCAQPDPSNPAVGLPGSAGQIQYRARAFPAPRILEATKGLGARGVLGSICPANTKDATKRDFGYRPIVRRVLERLAGQLPK